MTAICNGLALHGGFIPYNATFLVFSDYARNAVRMSALIPTHNIHVYTHDSIGLGEDGPTHQPVEHVASLRMIPGLEVWRPCDTVESAMAWKSAIEHRGRPSVLIFSRQNLPHQARNREQCQAIARGGYILREPAEKTDVIIVATGSEVGLAVSAADTLAAEGIGVRVVVEAGVSHYWHRFTGDRGKIVGVDRFGASAPAKALFEYYGLTEEKVIEAVHQSMAAAPAIPA